MKRCFQVVILLLGLTCGTIASAKGERRSSTKNTYKVIMSTDFDFDDTAIDGRSMAPEGFFLQGRQSQSLSQMVKLRSNFKRKLRNSRYGVKAISR